MSATIDIDEFRRTITPDLYDPISYIGWAEIEKNLAKYESAITHLQALVSAKNVTVETLESGFRSEPHLYTVLALLLALPLGEIGFKDGRELPEPTRPLTSHHATVASLLLDLGLPKLLPPGANVRDLVRVTVTHQDAGLRRYRVDTTIKDRLKAVLTNAIVEANKQPGQVFELLPEAKWPPPARGVDAILSVNSRPTIAVTSIFQTALGGRQQNQLSTQYPGLQRQLAEYGLNLILVADGRGVRGARDSVLKALFTGVGSCMTFRQASDGKLLEEMLRLAAAPPPTQERRALKGIIHAAVLSKGTVAAADLPADLDRARIALAAYLDENKELDLELNATGTSIRWRRKALVEVATNLSRFFQPEKAIDFFFQTLGGTAGPAIREDGIVYRIGELQESGNVLPQKLLVAASATAPNQDLFKRIATITLGKNSESKTSILLSPIVPGSEMASALRRLQSSLTANVILLDNSHLLRMAQSKEAPLSILVRQTLEQSDLVKASPFVISSVTPGRIFYGREKEEADMVSTLASNSIALLGGRRIGKTSLMRHAAARLRDGGFETFFADCQTVRDWSDFASLAMKSWDIQLPVPFRPAHLFDLVKQLKKTSGKKVVILLDEIDQLLDWDKQHTSDEVPEAFFRACRTVSQESDAQFVFSGERTIANRLWDPQSPHWNFCAPMMLRQLDQQAAFQLLMKPLQALQITIADKDHFAAAAWNRTSGHPQLLQTLGDRLLRRLNERPPLERASVSSRDLTELADTYSYADHFLLTYWGQSTPLERLLSILVATNTTTLEGCREFLSARGVSQSDSTIKEGLRMIELYGITDSSTTGYSLRLDWFTEAIRFYGTEANLIEQFLSKIK